MGKRILRGMIALPAAVLLGGTALATLAAPASAATAITACGTTITAPGSYTLGADIGPCPHDGIDIAASNVTLSLNGHTITGSDTTNTSGAPEDQQIGVHLLNVHGVTVMGPGTITHFDAGVAIDGGYGNVIQGLTVRDNIAHVILTGGVNNGDPFQNACDFGDGITADNSSGNVIRANTVTNNGPFSGIALVDNSDRNVVSGNQTVNNHVSNILPSGINGPCGPFGGNDVGRGRPHQNIGIRMEGPGANANVISGNTSNDNQLEGIAVFDNICPGADNMPNGTPNNSGNVIQGNTVLRNGGTDGQNGIAVLQQGPGGVVCVPSNTTIIGNNASNNTGNGIYLGGRGSSNNTVKGNTTNGNGVDGILVSGPSVGRTGPLPGSINNTLSGNTAMGNTVWDAFDGNTAPPCDNNRWTGNHFVKVNQSCIH